MPESIIVYDWRGNVRDLDYLRGRYGNFQILEAAAGSGPVYRIRRLREKAENDFDPAVLASRRYTLEGQAWEAQRLNVPALAQIHSAASTMRAGAVTMAAAALVVRVADEHGAAINGQRVAFYWPDAPVDPYAGPAGGLLPGMVPGRCVWGVTERGDVGFGMGRDSYFWPGQGQIGPHAVWVYGDDTRSDVILGLGMVALTDHAHFDVEYERVEGGDVPPEEEGDLPEYFDENGAEMAGALVREHYGIQDVHRPAELPRFGLVELMARSGDSKALAVFVDDEDGAPLPGVTIALGPRDRAGNVQRGVTDEDGAVTFDIGDETYRYNVPSEQGHWCVAVEGPASDVYNSAGWVWTGRKSPGRWFDLVFRRKVNEDVPEPPGPEPPIPPVDPELPDEARGVVNAVIEAIDTAVTRLEAEIDNLEVMRNTLAALL
ncbi:MAG: hypothetical protein EHM35_00455 [Planctomycetaceae bacterium]|nr:MAG: hypothetical protein EHM35_00455 [Planctomycetaceae bacterium]